MKHFAVVLAAALVTATAARAQGSPYATVERQVGSTRIIEHAPVSIPVVRAVRRSRVVVKRRRTRAAVANVSTGVTRVVALSEKQEFYPNASIAGGCRDGGLVRRRDVLGNLVLRQREICDSLAPLTGRRWSVAVRSP
jgi:hypothetical protein